MYENKFNGLPRSNLTSAKTPSKNRSKTSLTAQKYLHAKLEYSEKKQMTIQKVMEAKDQRIRQLQYEILQNQKLVKETLSKWEQYKQKVEKQKQLELSELRSRVRTMREQVQKAEREISFIANNNTKLEQDHESLKNKNIQITGKYDKLLEKYKEDKKQWKSVCTSLNALIEGLQKIPPSILQRYFP